MLREYTLRTKTDNWTNITRDVRETIAQSGIKNGSCIVYCPHTTAGVTINENTDPDVVRDLSVALNKTYPDRPEFRHAEGNSAAHMKATAVGSGVTLIVSNGKPLLGVWQGVFFCEFDGPRTRRYYVSVQGEGN